MRLTPSGQIILKIGVHKGAAIAVTLNDRLDYFGQTVNIAARVQNIADADELYISEQVFEADGVAHELEPLQSKREMRRCAASMSRCAATASRSRWATRKCIPDLPRKNRAPS